MSDKGLVRIFAQLRLASSVATFVPSRTTAFSIKNTLEGKILVVYNKAN